jgi:hypothetical protein
MVPDFQIDVNPASHGFSGCLISTGYGIIGDPFPREKMPVCCSP